MNCGNPQNNMTAFMCNVINNATQIFTNDQLIAYDALSEAEQYQADSIIQCAANMLLMNLGYNMQYAYSPVYVWESTQSSALQQIMQYRLADQAGAWNFAQISLQSMMEALIADPVNSPASSPVEVANMAGMVNTIFNTVYWITGDNGAFAMPGIYNVDQMNGAAGIAGSGPASVPGIQNDQYLGTVLYDLAALNVLQCFGDPTATANAISYGASVETNNIITGSSDFQPNGLDGFLAIHPDQFAPTTNIESLAAVMYVAFETAISGVTTQQNLNQFNSLVMTLSLNTTQAATLSSMQSVFTGMINAVSNNNIYPLLQLSGLYDLLNNDPADASGGTNYGMNIAIYGPTAGCVRENTWWFNCVYSVYAIPAINVYKAYFDYTGYNTAYSVQPLAQAPTLYQQLMSVFTGVHTETYDLALSNGLKMDITAQANGMAAQLSSQANFAVLDQIYVQLQQVNQNLNSINETLTQIEQTLQTIDQQLVAISDELPPSPTTTSILSQIQQGASLGYSIYGAVSSGDIIGVLNEIPDVVNFFEGL